MSKLTKEWLQMAISNGEAARSSTPLGRGWDPDSDESKMLEALKFALAAMDASTGNSPEFPDSWKLVPIEPTAKMIDEAMNCDDVEFNSDETFCVNFDNIYRAMLAAAPGGDE